MKSYKPIGGYFSLELSKKNNFPHQNAVLLGSARQCLKYLIEIHKIKVLYLPYYICDVIYKAVDEIGIEKKYYKLNSHLEIDGLPNLRSQNEYILYVNYFGLKDNYTLFLYNMYEKQLILDFSQAFFSKPLKNSNTFYSPRKFFGVPDGGCLYTNTNEELSIEKQSFSYNRFMHLIKRIDVSPEDGYDDFKRNEKSLDGLGIEKMSKLTQRILESIDYSSCANSRLENYKTLHQKLGSSNKIAIDLNSMKPALCYPYYTDQAKIREMLIKRKIYVPTYWPNVIENMAENSIEYNLAKRIIPLPIDQRYNVNDMNLIAEVVLECENKAT